MKARRWRAPRCTRQIKITLYTYYKHPGWYPRVDEKKWTRFSAEILLFASENEARAAMPEGCVVREIINQYHLEETHRQPDNIVQISDFQTAVIKDGRMQP